MPTLDDAALGRINLGIDWEDEEAREVVRTLSGELLALGMTEQDAETFLTRAGNAFTDETLAAFSQ